MIGLGFFVIFLLGNEVFLRALIPDKKEAAVVDRLFSSSPFWKKAFVVIGVIAGAVGAALFFIFEVKSESILVTGIPIGIFFGCFLFLQYIVPSIATNKSSED